jgi:hypothetical protein
MHRLLIWPVLLACFCASSAVIASENSIKKFNFNLGSFTEFYNQVQIDDSGNMRKLDLNPTMGLGLVIPSSPDFSFLSELNWVLPRKAGERIMKNIIMARADLGYLPVDWLMLRLGTSLMWLNQQGSGGTEKINNGNGTSTFYYPDENRSSLNTTLDIGVEITFSGLGLRFQTYTYAPFREERRQVSYSIFLSYYWDR